MNHSNPHARFYGLLAKLPYSKKEDLVWQYSGMLTNSLSEFARKNPRGYERMINEMQLLANTLQIPDKPNKAEIKRLRSAILHRLQKHGIDTTNWDKVNSFMQNPRIAGKRLYEMTEAEMQAFIPKMESILKKDLGYKTELDRLAKMN